MWKRLKKHHALIKSKGKGAFETSTKQLLQPLWVGQVIDTPGSTCSYHLESLDLWLSSHWFIHDLAIVRPSWGHGQTELASLPGLEALQLLNSLASPSGLGCGALREMREAWLGPKAYQLMPSLCETATVWFVATSSKGMMDSYPQTRNPTSNQ